MTAELLEHQDEYRDRIDELKHKHFYNLGHSGEVGADYIIGRLERRKKKKSAASSAEKIPGARIKTPGGTLPSEVCFGCFSV